MCPALRTLPSEVSGRRWSLEIKVVRCLGVILGHPTHLSVLPWVGVWELYVYA